MRLQAGRLGGQRNRYVPGTHAFQQEHPESGDLNVGAGGERAMIRQDGRGLLGQRVGKRLDPLL